jgi:hypothetical protein
LISKLADLSEKFHVTAVKIKLGSPPEAFKTVRDASGGKPAETIPDATQPFLLTARYPLPALHHAKHQRAKAPFVEGFEAVNAMRSTASHLPSIIKRLPFPNG